MEREDIMSIENYSYLWKHGIANVLEESEMNISNLLVNLEKLGVPKSYYAPF